MARKATLTQNKRNDIARKLNKMNYDLCVMLAELEKIFPDGANTQADDGIEYVMNRIANAQACISEASGEMGRVI